MLRLVHSSCRLLRLSQRARPSQVAAKNWKNFYLATVYHKLQCGVNQPLINVFQNFIPERDEPVHREPGVLRRHHCTFLHPIPGNLQSKKSKNSILQKHKNSIFCGENWKILEGKNSIILAGKIQIFGSNFLKQVLAFVVSPILMRLLIVVFPEK